jgi:tRNA A37 methylthiotransferase MiaB
LGKKLNVLIIGEGEKGYLEGRAYDYRCVIVKSEEKSLIGKFIDVEVKDVTPHYLIASPLN